MNLDPGAETSDSSEDEGGTPSLVEESGARQPAEPPAQPAATPAVVSGPKRLTFEFTGSGHEYFRIWIVNTLFSIATLGVYSAWAKVRTKNYFYRNTYLGDSAFEYLGDPVRILKGRLIVGAALALYALNQHFSLQFHFLLLGIAALLLPALVAYSLSFNARNTRYRGVRFGFTGTVSGAYGNAVKAVLVYLVTCGLGTPYAQYIISNFVTGRHAFGTLPFTFRATVGQYYRAYFLAILCVLPLALGVRFSLLDDSPYFATLMVSYFAMFVAGALVRASIANVILQTTDVGLHSLRSTMKTSRLFWISISNAAAIALTLGLFTPWAKVRALRYKLENVSVEVWGSDSVHNVEARGSSALGDAAVDLGNLDFGL